MSTEHPGKDGGWIGVDLDGTLAHYKSGLEHDPNHIGAPIPAMVARIREWLEDGCDVRIFTARVSGDPGNARKVIEDWCQQNLGRVLPVTCEKDPNMDELWDDKARQVEPNTGVYVGKGIASVVAGLAKYSADQARHLRSGKFNGGTPAHSKAHEELTAKGFKHVGRKGRVSLYAHPDGRQTYVNTEGHEADFQEVSPRV